MGLPSSRRLKKSKEYREVIADGACVTGAYMRLHILASGREDGPGARYGIAAVKRLGGAVLRNRVKRVLREQAKVINVPGNWKIVVIARSRCASASSDQVGSELRRMLLKGGLTVE